MVLNSGSIDAKKGGTTAEQGRVGRKFSAFGEINEGAYARFEKSVELWLVWVFWGPRIFAC
jgi:hypothetical protein